VAAGIVQPEKMAVGGPHGCLSTLFISLLAWQS